MKTTKQVNLIVLFQALGYTKGVTAKTQKSTFLKKNLGYEVDDAKKVVMVDLNVAESIVETFINNVATDAQIAKSEIAKTINLKDAKYYVTEDETPAGEVVIKKERKEPKTPKVPKKPKETLASLKEEIELLKQELEDARNEIKELLESAGYEDAPNDDDDEEND